MVEMEEEEGEEREIEREREREREGRGERAEERKEKSRGLCKKKPCFLSEKSLLVGVHFIHKQEMTLLYEEKNLHERDNLRFST
jgi:hypothetical protein